MDKPSENSFELIDLSEFLKGSSLLKPYKEEIGHFYGEQLLMAVDLWHQGRIDEALPIFDDVYEITPNFFLHKFLRIARNIREIDPEELLVELSHLPYNDYIENLDKFLYHLTKAVAQFKLFDMDDCADSCKKALEFITDFTPIYVLLADSLLIRYQYLESVQYYKKALKLGDYNVDKIKANLAYAYLCLKQNRKARRLFKQVVHAFPDNFKIQYNMAVCYLRKRQFKKALDYLEIVENLNPEFSGLHLTRGGIYLKQGSRTTAIQSLEKAVELGSEQASVLLRKLND